MISEATTPTPWGYKVPALTPIVTADEFATATGGVMSSTAERISWTLDAVSQVVRDFCGWHVAPAMECAADLTAEGSLVQLPTMGVQSVDVLTVDGHAVTDFEWLESGLIRLPRGVTSRKWRGVHVEWTAGYGATGAIGAALVQLASNALAAAPGVREEHAGQVGITYNQTANGVSGGIRLLESDKAMLDAYRIAEVR